MWGGAGLRCMGFRWGAETNNTWNCRGGGCGGSLPRPADKKPLVQGAFPPPSPSPPHLGHVYVIEVSHHVPQTGLGQQGASYPLNRAISHHSNLQGGWGGGGMRGGMGRGGAGGGGYLNACCCNAPEGPRSHQRATAQLHTDYPPSPPLWTPPSPPLPATPSPPLPNPDTTLVATPTNVIIIPTCHSMIPP